MKKIFLTLLIVLSLLSCDLNKERTVGFYASSTGGLVSGGYYVSSDGVYNWFIDAPSPWSLEMPGLKGDQVILTISDFSGGECTARIYVNGALFKEKTEASSTQVAGYIE